jgi:hypothetical protein
VMTTTSAGRDRTRRTPRLGAARGHGVFRGVYGIEASRLARNGRTGLT